MCAMHGEEYIDFKSKFLDFVSMHVHTVHHTFFQNCISQGLAFLVIVAMAHNDGKRLFIITLWLSLGHLTRHGYSEDVTAKKYTCS